MLVRYFPDAVYDRETAYDCKDNKIHIIDEQNLVLHFEKAVFTETEGCFKESTKLAEVFKVEDTEADKNDKLAVDVAKYKRYLFHVLFAYLHFCKDKDSVVNSPENEVPACTVPDTCAEPYEEKTAVLSALAEYWYIEDIIAEECTQ